MDAENTMLVLGVDKDLKQTKAIVPLPDKILVCADYQKERAQVLVYSDYDYKSLLDTDIRAIQLTITDDPYCHFDANIINLGYSTIRVMFKACKILNYKPLAIFTNLMNTSELMLNCSLRPVNKFGQTSRDYYEQIMSNDYICEPHHLYLEYSFGKSINDDISMRISKYDFIKKKGVSATFKLNLQSYYNELTDINEQEYSTIEEIMNLHSVGFVNINTPDNKVKLEVPPEAIRKKNKD